MRRSDLHRIIREEIQDHLIEEGIVSWLLDKAETFVNNALTAKADYQYARLANSPDFKALHKKFGMKEDEFLRKAKEIIKRDPKKFAKLLAYDVHNSSFSKYFK
jgi:hypothetical protein